MNGELTIKEYVLAGSAKFTIESKKSSKHFTYHVRCARNSLECESLHFVGVLTHPDNEKDYRYLGTIFDESRYYHGKKSKIRPDAPSAIAFRWLWAHIDQLPDCVKFHKSSYCCRCGRTLTVPKSIELGIGPECALKLGIDTNYRQK